MPIGTSEGEQHESDFEFHLDRMEKVMPSNKAEPAVPLDKMFNDIVYDDQPTEEQYMRTTGGIGKYDYLKNEERGMEARSNNKSAQPEDEAWGNNSTDYTPIDYKNWLNDQSKKLGRDVFQDTRDYDLESYYKDHKGEDMNAGHMTDKYKLPNHITFSSESKYHNTVEDMDEIYSKPRNNTKPITQEEKDRVFKQGGVDDPLKRHEGGQWDKLQDGSWTFTPGRTNLEQHSTQELIDYFKKYEKGNHLLLPGN